MSYRLMAADYDLTLTHSDHRISAFTCDTIRKVFSAGRMVTLASGRLGESAAVVNGIFPRDVPLIVGNGAALQSSASGRIFSETVMGEADALTILHWCRRRAATTIVYCREGVFADRENAVTEMYAQLSQTKPQLLSSPEIAARSGVYKALLLGPAGPIARAYKFLLQNPPCQVDCFTSSPEQLEIVAAGVNKGAALSRAAALLGIPREDIIAIGDGENDIPMLRWAGLAIAMENASDKVKAVADVIAPHCDQDGAARAMEKYLLEI